MPIPSAISDLSTTPSLNSPAGSESPALVDDYLRTHAAFIKQVSDSKDTLDAANVKLTGNQTIAGTKTFSSAPVVPDDSFSFAKIQNIATARILGRATAGTGDVEEISLGTNLSFAGSVLNAAGVTIASTAEAQTGTDNTKAISPLRLREGLNATGSAPIYACRAWVNFNGTGTVEIRASGNVSSITDNGTGDYTVNFTTAMPDANYCVNVSTERGVGASGFVNIGSYASSNVRISTFSSASQVDVTAAFVAIFR